MRKKVVSQIVSLVVRAQELASSIGIPNILQPGLIKEMIIAEILGHEVILTKRDADAHDPNNPEIKFEYLSCYGGGSGQLDRMFKEPLDKREESLKRIARNARIYLAIFYHNSLKVKTIYAISTEALILETERQLDRSKNSISHVGFTENWAKVNGEIVYLDKTA